MAEVKISRNVQINKEEEKEDLVTPWDVEGQEKLTNKSEILLILL